MNAKEKQAAMSNVEEPLSSLSVQRVRQALVEAGSRAEVIALAQTARTAEDAARACGVPVGAIVKSLVFEIADDPVLALIAGDRRCDLAALPSVFGRARDAKRCDAARVRAVTGFAIGGVAPIGHITTLPTVIDASLARFDRLVASAGHPYCVFATTLDELVRLTRGTLSATIATG